MSYSNNVIRKPINIQSDLGVVLGTGSGDLGYNIVNGNINKWSFRKPIRLNKVADITENEIASVRCGLISVYLTKMLRMTIGGSNAYSYTKDQCMAEIAEWGYNRPRGRSYNEWFRALDFDGYKSNAVAPDSGWTQLDIDQAKLTALSGLSVDVTQSGSYAGRNFKLQPKSGGTNYNSGLYSLFSMRIGSSSAEKIGDTTNMDIPIKYITELSGNWRLAVAVWIPNYGSTGKWGLFIGRETITQWTAEGGGSGTMANVFPDFGTNPLAAYYMNSLVNGGYEEFTAVPLLVKDCTYNYATVNGQNLFYPYFDGTTEECLCMPSGTASFTICCGEPPMPIYFSVSYTSNSGIIKAFITNTDTEAAHTFKYNVILNGTITSTGTVNNLAAGATKQVAGAQASGNILSVVVIEQDGTPIS